MQIAGKMHRVNWQRRIFKIFANAPHRPISTELERSNQCQKNLHLNCKENSYWDGAVTNDKRLNVINQIILHTIHNVKKDC